ncbi:MAG: hypothetical protein GY832_26060 [Chloroflexi bacterium]|nr:hypothetical protein [Chloroflexota bacterium]
MNGKNGRGNVADLVYAPTHALNSLIEFNKVARSGRGIQFGIPGIDSKVIPFRPGNTIIFCARPGHCKTSLMAYFARLEAQRIKARGTEDKECALFISWEQSVDELACLLYPLDGFTSSDVAWGRMGHDAMVRHSIQNAGTPIWLFGHGLSRTGARVPRMTPQVVLSAIERMADDYNGMRPTLLLFDYVQLIPTEWGANRVEVVTEATMRIGELAKRVGAPAIIGAQARREVDDRAYKIPQPRDAGWTSEIEKICDKFFGLYRPSLDRLQMIELPDGETIPVTPRLLLIEMGKQRFEHGRATWPLYFEPETLKLAELETAQADPAF